MFHEFGVTLIYFVYSLTYLEKISHYRNIRKMSFTTVFFVSSADLNQSFINLAYIFWVYESTVEFIEAINYCWFAVINTGWWSNYSLAVIIGINLEGGSKNTIMFRYKLYDLVALLYFNSFESLKLIAFTAPSSGVYLPTTQVLTPALGFRS